MTNPTPNAAPSGGRPLTLVGRGWAVIVDGLAALGTVLIGILMLIICADIVARNIFGSSLPLVSESGALLVVLIVALQLASTIRAGRLAFVELFIGEVTDRFPRFGAVLKACFSLAGAAMLGIVAWASAGIFSKDLAVGEFIGVTGMGTLPTWPFRALIMLGMAAAALQFVDLALRELGKLLPSRRNPS